MRDATGWRSGAEPVKASPARRYNYWLGGSAHSGLDRKSADAVSAAFPTVRCSAVENRRFVHRAVAYLSRSRKVRQFLDVGSGIPTSTDNTHQIAQQIAPSSRVVYVDNDPVVFEHVDGFLRSDPAGETAYLEADLRSPDRILADLRMLGILDFTRPIAVVLAAVLHFIKEVDNPYLAVSRLVSAMPSGSYLVASQATQDFMSPEEYAAVNAADAQARVPFQFRTREQFARFFVDLDLLESGIVGVETWGHNRPKDHRPGAGPAVYAAVARIP